MRSRAPVLAALVISTVCFIAEGCHPRAQQPPGAAAAADSVQGVVSVTGTAFEQQIMVRVRAGDRDRFVTLGAAATDQLALRRLAGVETRIRGRQLADLTMRVESFTAISVGAVPVVDGVIVNEGVRLFLRTSNGLRLIGNPPSQLREMVSARVWIGGSMESGPNTYGVIVPPLRRP